LIDCIKILYKLNNNRDHVKLTFYGLWYALGWFLCFKQFIPSGLWKIIIPIEKNEDLKASVRKERNILSREKEKEVSLFVDEPLRKK